MAEVSLFCRKANLRNSIRLFINGSTSTTFLERPNYYVRLLEKRGDVEYRKQED